MQHILLHKYCSGVEINNSCSAAVIKASNEGIAANGEETYG
jgi:hypothetical protein